MKAALIFSAGLLLQAGAYARQTTQQKGAGIQTGRQQQDTNTQSTQTNPAATGRRSTASWHYRSGQKRPQVKIEESPDRAEDRKTDTIEKSDSTGK